MLLGFGLMVLVVLFVSFFWSRDARLKRRMRKLPRRSIRDTPEGVDARVSGRLRLVDDQPPLHAPLSGRPCAAWRVVVQERRGSGNNRRWVTIVEDQASTEFILEDGTGRAVIDGTAITVIVDIDDTGGIGMFEESPQLERFLTERGISFTGLLWRKTFRYREGILEAGETVTVAGSGTWEADPSQLGGGYRDVGKRLLVKALSDGQLLATDDRDAAWR